MNLILICILTLTYTGSSSKHSPKKNSSESPQKIAIKGAGPVGLIAANAVLKNFPNSTVTVFDSRHPTRRIQWGVRPAFLDAMYYYDENLGKRVLGVAKKLRKYSLNKEDLKAPQPELPDRNFLKQKTTRILVCNEFQQVVKENLNSFGDRFTYINEVFDDSLSGEWDLIVNAGGAGNQKESQTLTTIEETHLAAVVKLNKNLSEGFSGAEEFIRRKGGEVGIIGSNGHNDEMWIVVRVPSWRQITPDMGLNEAEVQNHHKQTIREAFNLLKNNKNVRDENDPFGNDFQIMEILNVNRKEDLRSFEWAPHLTNNAVSHANETPVVSVGDSVGNGHWFVGGGMQVGTILHIQRLLKLLQTGVSKQSLAKYSKMVIADTHKWIEEGKDFLVGEPIKYDDSKGL